jgi:hypothetical protein
MIEELSVRAEGQQAVVERAVAGSLCDPFVDAGHYNQVVLAGRFAEPHCLFAEYDYAVLAESREDPLRRLVVPEGRAGAVVEPGGVAGQPRLA